VLVAEPIENFNIIVAEAHLANYVRENIANFCPSGALAPVKQRTFFARNNVFSNCHKEQKLRNKPFTSNRLIP